MTTAIGYVRVSTEQQSDRGISIEAQTAKIRAMAAVQDLTLTDVFRDAGESAKTLKRPGLQQIIERVQARTITTVIVAKLDRLTRSVRDLADLLELFNANGVALVSVAESLDTGSAAGRLVLNVMTSVSQWEREAIGERTRDALQHKRALGQRVGTVPYGFRVSDDRRTLAPNPDERNVLRTMAELRMEGAAATYREIAVELNRLGHRTRKRTPWRVRSVAPLVQTALNVYDAWGLKDACL